MTALDAPLDMLMTPDPVVVEPDDAVDVAEAVMRLGRANEWPVALGRSLVGVVTIGDLLAERGRARDGTHCADVMSSVEMVAHPSDPLALIARAMLDHRLSCIPVVAGDELVGLVTLTDFVELAVEHLDEEARRFGSAPIVAHLMTHAPTSVRPEDSVAAAQAIMEGTKIRHLPVQSRGKLVGIVAQRDLVWALRALARPAGLVPVRSIMTPWPRTTTPDAEAADAGRILVHHGVGALPVVRGDRPIGILSKRDFLRHLVSVSPSQERAWS
jgi:CBS domain-containing protein